MNSQWSASDREKEYFNLRRTKEQTKKKIEFQFSLVREMNIQREIADTEEQKQQQHKKPTASNQ